MTASNDQPWQGQRWPAPGGPSPSADQHHPGAAPNAPSGVQPWPEWAQRGGHPQQAPQAQPPGHSQPPAQFTASQIPSSYQPQPGGASHPAQPEPTVPWAQVQQTDSGP